MATADTPSEFPVFFVGHGGGPAFLLDSATLPMATGMDKDSRPVKWLSSVASTIPTPKKIIIISAHWEATDAFRVTTAADPELLFDYYGFPSEAYDVKYPAPGDPKLAEEIIAALRSAGLPAKGDDTRAFDHGVFIPLKVMFPEANIPVVQVSMRKSLDPAEHIALGEALKPFRSEGCFIIGSGEIQHNFHEIGRPGETEPDSWALEFHEWLRKVISLDGVSGEERVKALCDWEKAPSARRSHPREDHLVPIFVCAGAAGLTTPGVLGNDEWVMRNLPLGSYMFGAASAVTVDPSGEVATHTTTGK